MLKVLTKTDLASAIQKENGLTFTRFQQFIETILKIIKETHGLGEEVFLSGSGKFYMKHKSEIKVLEQ